MAKAPETASTRLIYGFHAVSAKLRHAPDSVLEIFLSGDRKDARVRKFVAQAEAAGARITPSEGDKLDALVGTRRHQGVVAKVDATRRDIKLADVLDSLDENALILVLDGVQDPHN
ncbi:MAG: RNA methyltransferase substrate-binding domain-containing protein, partial [Thauera propionica]|nr:RNA methyltransferase substrate-binding domain-containing protein [Thauera propionica]